MREPVKKSVCSQAEEEYDKDDLKATQDSGWSSQDVSPMVSQDFEPNNQIVRKVSSQPTSNRNIFSQEIYGVSGFSSTKQVTSKRTDRPHAISSSASYSTRTISGSARDIPWDCTPFSPISELPLPSISEDSLSFQKIVQFVKSLPSSPTRKSTKPLTSHMTKPSPSPKSTRIDHISLHEQTLVFKQVKKFNLHKDTYWKIVYGLYTARKGNVLATDAKETMKRQNVMYELSELHPDVPFLALGSAFSKQTAAVFRIIDSCEEFTAKKLPEYAPWFQDADYLQDTHQEWATQALKNFRAGNIEYPHVIFLIELIITELQLTAFQKEQVYQTANFLIMYKFWLFKQHAYDAAILTVLLVLGNKHHLFKELAVKLEPKLRSSPSSGRMTDQDRIERYFYDLFKEGKTILNTIRSIVNKEETLVFKSVFDTLNFQTGV